ncbi:MAG: SRPBCC family protein [Mycobacterium sp.]
MTAVSRTRSVAAPISAVWGVLADFGSLSAWAADIDHSCLLEHGDDVTAVGTLRRVQVGRNTLVERITVSAAPTTLAYNIEGLPRRMGRVSNRWSLTPAGSATAVTLTSTVRIGDNPVAGLAERAMCRFMAKQSDALLAGLAAQVEGLP